MEEENGDVRAAAGGVRSSRDGVKHPLAAPGARPGASKKREPYFFPGSAFATAVP